MKKLLIAILVVICAMLFVVSASAAAPVPQKPDLGVDFGTVSTIDGFTPPSQLYVDTDERVLLTDGNGNYVTYPAYYITKDSTTFDVNFNNLNGAQSVQYTKASIVMLEVPNGVTTLNNSYFAGNGFAACVSVQIPGTVTSYGSSLFSTNEIIKSVEFLDGTTPVTMGDAMFGGNWSTGPVSIQYVKFPNNLTSIGNNTFGKAKKVSKTVIFGENLESIGTGFFGESTPSSTDTFLYVSDVFFTETAMFENLFGNEAPYHGNNLFLTMFYTGTEEQANNLVAKGLEVQTGYVWDANKVKIVSADEYVYDTHKPTSSKSITIVYDYNACDAFYYGIHEEKDTVNGSACYLAECKNCGIKSVDISTDKTHNFTSTYVYENGYTQSGKETLTCTNAGCIYCADKEPKVEALAPIFKNFQYSVRDDDKFGIVMEYDIDTEALAVYEAGADTTVNFGVVAIAEHKYNSEKDLVKVDGTTEQTNIILANVSGKGSQTVSLIINGAESQWNQYKETPFYILGYAINAGTVEYFQNASKNNFADLDTISYDQAKGVIA